MKSAGYVPPPLGYTAPMSEAEATPAPRKRRWYQFRPSTWFVLVAILAWIIVFKPLAGIYYEDRSVARLSLGHVDEDGAAHLFLGGGSQYPQAYWTASIFIGDNLMWPASAFAAFLAWKIVERRRARQATTRLP